MKILVIEDSAAHRQSAIETLVGHDVTVVGSFDGAEKLLDGSYFDRELKRIVEPPLGFDVVLTDMMMPMSERGLTRDTFKPTELVPYGIILALKAAHRGAKLVGLLTDTNHHNGAMSKALDLLGPAYYDSSDGNPEVAREIKRFEINGAKVVFVHAPFVLRIEKSVVCDLCAHNPGVCSNCDATGLNKDVRRNPRECWDCHKTDHVGKCKRCKGTGRYDKIRRTKVKDWARVLNLLLTDEDAPTYLEFNAAKNASEEE